MIEINNRNNKNKDLKNTTRSDGSQRHFRESKVKIFTKNDIKESINIKNEKNNPKKKKIIIAIVSLISLVLITGIVLIIGHLCFSWFKNKEPLIIDKIKEEKLVSRYSEVKKSINYYNYEGVDEDQKVQSHSLNTDFIVGLNKKERLDKIYDFNNIDYLYEWYILILNITHSNETNSMYLGGLNIYDETKSLEDLIEINNEFLKKYEINNAQINIPFAKFYVYENGTLDKIYFPEGINDYYKTLIIDLIEKITPKLSKYLYKDESNKRRLENGNEGTYLNYEEITRNGKLDKTIIYEDKIEKNSDKEKDEFTFENKQLNSKTVRIFNSTGDMTLLDMEGEFSFISSRVKPGQDIKYEKIRENEEIGGGEKNSNESFYNLGFNEFKLNAKSNMQLIKNGLEPETLANLKRLSELIKMELYQAKKFSIFKEEKKESEEKDINEGDQEKKSTEALQNNENNLKRNLATDQNLNFISSHNFTYNIITLDFLGLSIELNQKLHINNKSGLRKNILTLNIGNKEINLDSVSLYQYYYSGTKTNSKDLFDKSSSLLNKNFDAFGYLVGVGLQLEVEVKNGIYINITNGEMYVKGFETAYLGVSGNVGLNLLIVSFGAKIIGHIADGTQYILANTISKYGQTRVEYYKKLSSCSVDLELYFSVWILFWKKTFSTTFNLFKGFSSYEKYYQIL